MTNAEVYIGDEDLIDQFIDEFNEFVIENSKNATPLRELIEQFFKQERKPPLTDDERVILRNICFQPIKDFYISRKHGTLKLHNKVDELYDFFAYDHLFQFIKERRRIFY